MIFGRNGQSIHETNPKNTTNPRTFGVIYLRALDTLQGGFEVVNLITENVISSQDDFISNHSRNY